MTQQLLSVWASGDAVPFLVMFCDEVVDKQEGELVVLKEDVKVVIDEYSFYQVRPLTEEDLLIFKKAET